MATYQYLRPGASLSGCPGTAVTGGWYLSGSNTPIVSSYSNPATGMAYTPQELAGLAGGTTPAGTTTSTAAPTGDTTTGGNINPYTGTPFTTADLSGMGVATAKDFWIFYNQGLIQDGKYVGPAGAVGTGGWGENEPVPYNIPGTTMPTTPVTPTMPVFGEGAEIPLPKVTPAPPYEKTPEQIAFEQMYTGQLTDWVEAGGYGIPEETQAQMIQQQTDVLKAREQESLRVMRNTMERRGLTNSGLVFANEQAIRSNTSVAIAGAIADVQIKSVLMKLASFEKAMGQAGQFLGYLSEQSQLQYQPEFATWQAEQFATLQQWQGKMDVLKMDINQAYAQGNINLANQWAQILQDDQQAANLVLAEMELEAQKQQAMATGAGNLMGSASGIVLSMIGK